MIFTCPLCLIVIDHKSLTVLIALRFLKAFPNKKLYLLSFFRIPDVPTSTGMLLVIPSVVYTMASSMILLFLLCFRPPFRAVCANHEVLVFQPRKRNALDLGCISNYKSYSNSPAPTVSTYFLDILISPPISHRHYIRSVIHHIPSLTFHPLPTSTPGAKRRPPRPRLHP